MSFSPRHPSQLYEAFFEGIVVFAILNWLWKYAGIRRKHGMVSAMFILLYGIFRILMEQFREPDAQLGYFFSFLTMGQLLSLPLIVIGAGVIWYLFRQKKEIDG